jgi:UDP:flavonoid glycosyltransferase YjiC (YdhE family)
VLVDAPLDQALDDADLVVAHGGAGTVLTALGRGIPMLLVPQLPDHASHAARVFAAGAGEVLRVDEASPARLYAEVRRLLDEPGVRSAAQQLGRRMRSAPTATEIAARLPDITRDVTYSNTLSAASLAVRA